MLTKIENGCKMGYPVLLEDIQETLDPSLNPIMEKDIRKDKGQWKIKLSGGLEDYSLDFKFTLTTKLGNPHYLPEVCIKVTLINFTVTPLGLEDQLLVEVVKFESPELEEQRDQLIVQLSDFKKQKAELEAKILKLVAESGEDILDDEELIVTLDQSKQTSITINKKVEEAEKTAITINNAREEYRTVAIRGSVLYFVISDIGNINEMYQYSLDFFMKLFNRRLEMSKKSKDIQERVEILINDVTTAFYNNICRGLFEQHKLLYAYLNTTSIKKRSGEISTKEWGIYTRGSQTDFSA
jgi:dynein heavy chain